MFVIVIHRVRGRHNTHKVQTPFPFLEHNPSFQIRITITNDTIQNTGKNTLHNSSYFLILPSDKKNKSRKERREVNFFGPFHFHNLLFHFTIFIAAIKTVKKVNKWENENRVHNNLIFDVLFILWRLWTCWQQERMGNFHIWRLYGVVISRVELRYDPGCWAM